MFRKAAVQHQRQRLYGRVLIPRKPGLAVLSSFLLLLTVGSVVLLCLGTYARRQHVRGLLVPSEGVSRLYASQSGVVEELYVKEGQLVEAGAPLLLVGSSQQLADGRAVQDTLLQAVTQQIEEVGTRLELAASASIARHQELRRRIQALAEEIGAVRRQAVLQGELVELAKERLATHETLNQEKVSSRLEVEKYRSELLSAQSQQEQKLQQVAALERELARARHEQEQSPTRTADEAARLRVEIARLRERSARLELEGGYTLTAPVRGRVYNVSVSTGEGVTTDQPLLSILPEHESLKARLFVPTNGVGFVREGTPLHLMVDAFPYQRFGMRKGTVSQVAQVVLLPDELPQLGDARVPAYQVVATLDQNYFSAYGVEHALRPGMEVSADLLLEERSLLEWLFEPVLAVRERL